MCTTSTPGYVFLLGKGSTCKVDAGRSSTSFGSMQERQSGQPVVARDGRRARGET